MKKYIKELDILRIEAEQLSVTIHICKELLKRKDTVPVLIDMKYENVKPLIEIDPEFLLSYVEKKLELVKDKIDILDGALATASDVVKEVLESYNNAGGKR